MTREQAEILNRLFEDGYIIHIDTPGYETSNVTMIELAQTADDENEDYVYDDDTITQERLIDIDISQVRVSARVDWLGLIPKEERSIHNHMFGTDIPVSLQDWNDDLDKAYNR